MPKIGKTFQKLTKINLLKMVFFFFLNEEKARKVIDILWMIFFFF